MKTFFIAISLFICFTQMFHCQEDDGVVSFVLPVRNSMTFNRYVINPTFSFVREQTKYISITNKREWVQFENAPETYLASFAGRFGENIGAGIGVFQQNYGVLTTFGGVLNFAYNAQLSRTNNLTFGLNVGAYSSGVNTSNVITNFEDPSVQNVPKNFLLTVNPGINYGTDFFDFGVSINNLATYNVTSSNLVEDNPEQGIQGHLMYTGYFNNKGFFDESKFSGLLRSEFKKDETVISALAMVTVPKGIWAQVGYNTVYGASAGLGLNITKSIAIEYNYETAFGDLSVFGASHEIALAYRFSNNRSFKNSNDDEVAGIFSGTKTRRKSRPSRNRNTNKTVVSTRKNEAEVIAEKQAEKDAEVLAKLEAEKSKIAAQEQAKALEAQKAKQEAENENARLEAEAKAEAEKIEKSKAEAQAKIVAEKAKAKQEAELKAKLAAQQKAKLIAEQKTKEEAIERAENQAKLELQKQEKAKADAQAKLIAEQNAAEQAKLELERQEIVKAEADAKLVAEQKAKEEADAQAKLIAEQKARQATEEKLRLEEEQKKIAEAEAQAKVIEAQNATEELISSPKDEIGKDMYALDQQTKDSKSAQSELFIKLNEAVAAKNQTLKDLKEENDLSEKGITVAPKPFKSITAENNALNAIKSDLDNIIKIRTNKIEELKALYEDKYQADTITNDVVMLYYKNAIKRLTAEQTAALETRVRLDAQLEAIKVATEFERRRRIKRADFDNEEKKYAQDRAVLQSLKENTPLASTPYKVSDFDFGEEQSENIQILKNVNNIEEGYFLVLAVHNDKAKRDEFLKKVIASGRTNVDFFYDVNTSKYYIYYDKFESINAATKGLNSKGDRPYNEKMSLIKIEK